MFIQANNMNRKSTIDAAEAKLRITSDIGNSPPYSKQTGNNALQVYVPYMFFFSLSSFVLIMF